MVRITKDLVRKKSEHNECLISSLEELSLHQEDIEIIENVHNWCRDLKILLLQSNLISKIENLYKLKKLEYLNLAINNIERVENLEKLESLDKLDLTLNFIGDLTSVESLRDNYNLRQLILTGNPCCDYPHYREYVIATLPQLDILDCEEIKKTHKLQAQKQLTQYRSVIVQKQTDYAIQRDEQKLRFQQHKYELEVKMSTIDDEEERIKTFWNAKSEHCPEIRAQIAKYQKMGREKKNQTNNGAKAESKMPRLFASCGRAYNLNQPKLHFNFKDEDIEYILELDVYKHLDTSQILADVETNYVRVTVKGKIFQIGLSEDVNVSAATVQRSQITGQLVIRIPKLHFETLMIKKTAKDDWSKARKKKRDEDFKSAVDIKSICSEYGDVLPELV